MENDERAIDLFKGFWQQLKGLFVNRQWDGSASRYESTEQYCSACLIDVNSAAGREEKAQSHCKLPVKNPGSDSIDPEGLQAAAGGRGVTQVTKPADVPQDAWDSAVKSAANTIIREYPRLLDTNAPDSVYEVAGREPPEERAISSQRLQQALWSRMFELDSEIEGSDHYLVDMYFDEGGVYALYVDRGKLYRYQVAVQNDDIALGERVEVMEVHQPLENRTVIRQQADGRNRWFSISGTAVLNRNGEIDSRELFDSFIAYAEQTGEYPIRQFYHQGEVFRTGQADFLARDDYCYITSGLYDETDLAKAEVAARQTNPIFWGDSIGFFPTTDPELVEISNGIKIPVYRQGINKEISTLPENEASHLFTRTEVNRMSLDGKAWEAFVALWDDDEEKARQWLEEHPEARNRAIEEAGMIRREDDTDSEEESAEFEIDDSVIEVITHSVIESDVVKNLSDELTRTKSELAEVEQQLLARAKEVEGLVKRLEKLEKGKVAEQQEVDDDTPAKFKEKTRVVYRPRVANAATVEDGVPYNQKAESNMPKGAY